jgi:hypothetical protein
LYAIGLFLDQFGLATTSWWIVALLLAPCMEVAAWESARKIRIPEDETDYGTYSKALGWRAAALLPVAFVTLALASLLPIGVVLELGWTFTAPVATAGVIAIAACLRFRLAPTRARARLQPFMEVFGAVAHGALLLALLMRYGASW